MSRDPADLHPELRRRWEVSAREYARRYSSLPQPFLTQTYRSSDEQDALYAQGRTKPGKVVTNARGGQSLHNYRLAFDIAFKDARGRIVWDVPHFRRFAAIAKANGLAWGGDWRSFKDYPHFDPPGYTWRDALAGKVPTFGVITSTGQASSDVATAPTCACCGQVIR